MSLAIIFSRASSGIHAPQVTVEAHLSNGLPAFYIVGLAATAVKESKDRVRSALMNTAFEFPTRRITINLAPADLPKEGGRFDLPIALGILAASNQIPHESLSHYEFVGELALSGELRPVRGVLPLVLAAKGAGRKLIVPYHNAQEASFVKDAEVFYAKHILEVCAFLRGETSLPACTAEYTPPRVCALDLLEVKGQTHAKQALLIAAAGRHSLLFMGPPGTGKTMLASRLPSILPPLTDEQALAIASIASISNNGFDPNKWQEIPFRSPHHSSSHIALVGGGRPPRPGEISLAHEGVLFLDELPEFNRQVLESLREPFESGAITISRAAYQTLFPARFQFVAAMNPCPCGYAGSAREQCRCTSEQVQRYLAKLSGPLLDRIDMHVEVPSLSAELLSEKTEESSAFFREKVMAVRSLQFARQNKCNADLTTREVDEYCVLDHAAASLLKQVMSKFNFSARVYYRILKVARTLADLIGGATITSEQVSQCLTFRSLDKRST